MTTEHSGEGNEKDEKKVTSEKPVSLNPVDFKNALRDLLNIKPPKKGDSPDKKKPDSK